MGSPTTTVDLYVHKKHSALARQMLMANGTPVTLYDEEDIDILTYQEISHGELDDLEELQNHGIAYEVHVQGDFQVEPGTHYCRFTEAGEKVLKWVPEAALSIAIGDLLMHLDDHEALKQLIKGRHAATLVLGWENQLDYGKRHQLVRLTD